MKKFVPIAAVTVCLSVVASGDAPFQVSEICSTSPNSSGPGVVLSLEGVVGHHPDLACTVGGPGATYGMLLYGGVPASPGLPWGGGELCISPFQSSNGHFPVTYASLHGTVDVPLTDPENPSSFPFGPGETGYFQYLYRDGASWNLSNALQVTFAP